MPGEAAARGSRERLHPRLQLVTLTATSTASFKSRGSGPSAAASCMYETIVCKCYARLHLKTSVTKNNMHGYVGSCVAMKDEGLAMITTTAESCVVYQTRAL